MGLGGPSMHYGPRLLFYPRLLFVSYSIVSQWRFVGALRLAASAEMHLHGSVEAVKSEKIVKQSGVPVWPTDRRWSFVMANSGLSTPFSKSMHHFWRLELGRVSRNAPARERRSRRILGIM